MGATILALAKSALFGTGFVPPASIISTTSNVQQQLNAVIRAESEFLRNQRIFPQCKRVLTFPISAGRSKYSLPEDFYSALYRTQWDTSAKWEMLGPVSDADWNLRLYGVAVTGPQTAYRIFGPDMNPQTTGGQFQVNPIPATSDVISYEYITKTMFIPPFWSANTVVAATSYRSASGNIYFTTAGGTTGATNPTATSSVPVDGTVTWTYITAPYETIITDSDLSLFDDDIMIAGIRYRYQTVKGVDSSQAKAEHDALVDSAVARWTGNFRISLAQSDFIWARPNLPSGSWTL